MRSRSVILLVAASWLGCTPNDKNPPAEEKKDEAKILSVFNWTDYIGEETIPRFEQRTGIQVRYDSYSSNEELLAKLETGGAQYDVIFPSGYAVEILLRKGMLAKLDKTIMQNLKNVAEEFRSPYFDEDMEYCIPYTWSTTGIGYDSELITHAEAGSWEILFDARFKGKILMLDDVRASVGMALKYVGASVNSVNPAELQKARDVLLKQRPLVHVYASGGLPQLFGSGEVSVGYGWSGDIRQAQKINPKVHYRVPKGGSLIYVDYICIPASSANVVEATRFIDHILDSEISLEIAKTTAYATTNSAARSLAGKELKGLWADLDEWDKEKGFELIRNLGLGIDLYDRLWREVKSR